MSLCAAELVTGMTTWWKVPQRRHFPRPVRGSAPSWIHEPTNSEPCRRLCYRRIRSQIFVAALSRPPNPLDSSSSYSSGGVFDSCYSSNQPAEEQAPVALLESSSHPRLLSLRPCSLCSMGHAPLGINNRSIKISRLKCRRNS